ncbi:efflux RND transporter periplasmic adaptor subunit [Vibrio astriarenae]|uniref:Efflux RND transporter periplasmic adaptor subunit n=1 Tax=Vibrio astriarenae TaxID=1481923 RepID=A0A7Z2T352_9VIBR|nr:efflux RND transporter periplasmic adaptor subunit [Vibrio astriarenae]QIA63385.1 efflux RND transporter periplasmic adaptor subunit [Vibrio astriarenae]
MSIKPICKLYLVSSIFMLGCDNQQSSAPSAALPAPSIGYTVVQAQPLELTDNMPGRTLASFKAEVRPQVGGILLSQLFQEGAFIDKGQPLYQIDPDSFQVSLDSAKADLRRAKANLATASNRAKRYERLVQQNAVSRQDYDDAVASLQQAQSDVETAQASIDSAQINLDYTQVTSPISGRIGRSSVTEGALVTANQSEPLAIVQTYDPMFVDLTASSNDLLTFRRALSAGDFSRSEQDTTNIQLTLEDGSDYEYKGTILFSDVNISESTGAFVLRVSFPNPDNILLPGMFVRATLPKGVASDAILVPAKSVSRTPQGTAQVWVIDENGVVDIRTVTADKLINNQWLITEGLNSGEKVVAVGLQFIRPGMSLTNTYDVSDKYQN